MLLINCPVLYFNIARRNALCILRQEKEVSMVTQKIKDSIALLEREIAEVYEELDRVDGFAIYRSDLKKRLKNLQAELDGNRKFLSAFGEDEVKPAVGM